MALLERARLGFLADESPVGPAFAPPAAFPLVRSLSAERGIQVAEAPSRRGRNYR